MEKKRHGRSIARENAFQALYSFNITNETKETYSKDKIANDMVINTLLHLEEINSLINKNLKKWTFSQMNKVNISILQLAIYELKYVDTPSKIVVNEALELAKKYSDIKSKNFIHKTLDTISKG